LRRKEGAGYVELSAQSRRNNRHRYELRNAVRHGRARCTANVSHDQECAHPRIPHQVEHSPLPRIDNPLDVSKRQFVKSSHAWVFDDHFVRTHTIHVIIKSVGARCRVSSTAQHRRGIRNDPDLPFTAIRFTSVQRPRRELFSPRGKNIRARWIIAHGTEDWTNRPRLRKHRPRLRQRIEAQFGFIHGTLLAKAGPTLRTKSNAGIHLHATRTDLNAVASNLSEWESPSGSNSPSHRSRRSASDCRGSRR